MDPDKILILVNTEPFELVKTIPIRPSVNKSGKSQMTPKHVVCMTGDVEREIRSSTEMEISELKFFSTEIIGIGRYHTEVVTSYGAP